jgi:hypothetical protein|tara:strand:+ start:18961 stop:19143 length:183 start_codon:yes stop_codon:yes gene_type:complete
MIEWHRPPFESLPDLGSQGTCDLDLPRFLYAPFGNFTNLALSTRLDGADRAAAPKLLVRT